MYSYKAAWYLPVDAGICLLALVVFRLKPYRPAQRALGESIHENRKVTSGFKAAMYDVKRDIDEAYRKTTQPTGNHKRKKQDALRETAVLKTKKLMKDPSKNREVYWYLLFADTVDLYETGNGNHGTTIVRSGNQFGRYRFY
jgi:Sec-independent protein translocase protein TatA